MAFEEYRNQSSAARTVSRSGFLPAFNRGRSTARNTRTMRRSVSASNAPPHCFRICAAHRVANRYHASRSSATASLRSSGLNNGHCRASRDALSVAETIRKAHPRTRGAPVLDLKSYFASWKSRLQGGHCFSSYPWTTANGQHSQSFQRSQVEQPFP